MEDVVLCLVHGSMCMNKMLCVKVSYNALEITLHKPNGKDYSVLFCFIENSIGDLFVMSEGRRCSFSCSVTNTASLLSSRH